VRFVLDRSTKQEAGRLPMAGVVFDESGLQGLQVLIAVVERDLGRETATAKELRNLFEQRSSIAYLRASASFNALSGDVRSRVAAKANAVARQFHNPPIDVRKLFPDLFKPRSSERVWE
jgi:hypothetical protein